MIQKKQQSKVLNTIFLIVMIGFFVYYIYSVFTLGFSNDVFGASQSEDLYKDMSWVGLFVSFAGSVIAYINRSKESSFLRGIMIGFVIGIVVLTIIISIIKPDSL